jgi:Tol biopolymer transport system component
MTPEDGNSVELETGSNPAWLPGDKQIVFTKPNGGNYALTIIDVDGANAVNPIPDNSSFYSFPMVSYDDQKTYIYFISNRQIQQRGDPKCWGLYYVEWKQ